MGDLEHTGRIQALCTLAERHARFARASIDRACTALGEAFRCDLEAVLRTLYADDRTLECAVKGYAAFAVDAMRRQTRFERERVYPAKTFADAARDVYHNDEFMEQKYLPGLLLSHYLWPHHYAQLCYFRDTFVRSAAVRGVVRFAEVGVGTGVYSRTMLQNLPTAHGAGFDISARSLRFTANHVRAFGLEHRYELFERDIVASPVEPTFDAVLCVEVLEHLEDPVTMLSHLGGMVRPGGKLFVTAALNAANADHIYLYREPGDVLAHARAAGLHVEHALFANAYPGATPDTPVPSALAMVLTPRS